MSSYIEASNLARHCFKWQLSAGWKWKINGNDNSDAAADDASRRPPVPPGRGRFGAPKHRAINRQLISLPRALARISVCAATSSSAVAAATSRQVD
jgi:hypothetical protein